MLETQEKICGLVINTTSCWLSFDWLVLSFCQQWWSSKKQLETKLILEPEAIYVYCMCTASGKLHQICMRFDCWWIAKSFLASVCCVAALTDFFPAELFGWFKVLPSLSPGPQVRTLFVSGLPVDIKPRELYLLFRPFKVRHDHPHPCRNGTSMFYSYKWTRNSKKKKKKNGEMPTLFTTRRPLPSCGFLRAACVLSMAGLSNCLGDQLKV